MQFSISTLFSSIWPIDSTLSGATTSGQSGPGSNGNKGVLCIPQSSNITGASPSDCLVSYPGHVLGESVYSAALADWANLTEGLNSQSLDNIGHVVTWSLKSNAIYLLFKLKWSTRCDQKLSKLNLQMFLILKFKSKLGNSWAVYIMKFRWIHAKMNYANLSNFSMKHRIVQV